MAKLYSLSVNGQPVLEIDAQIPLWFPVRPKLPRAWLRGLVVEMIREWGSYTVLDQRHGSGLDPTRAPFNPS